MADKKLVMRPIITSKEGQNDSQPNECWLLTQMYFALQFEIF